MEYKLKSLDDAKVFDLLNEMVYIADAVTQEILFVNAALRQRIGLAGGDLSGLTCYKLMHGLDAPCAKCKGIGLKKELYWNRETDTWYHPDCMK